MGDQHRSALFVPLLSSWCKSTSVRAVILANSDGIATEITSVVLDNITIGAIQVPNDSQASIDKKTVESYYPPETRFASVYLLPDDGDILTPANFQLVGSC